MTSGFVYPVKHSHYYKAISHLITDESKQKALEHIQGTLVFSSVCSLFCLWARHPGCLLCLLIPFIYIAVLTLLMCSIIYKTADLTIRWAIEQTSGSVTFSLGTAGWKPLWVHTLQKVLKVHRGKRHPWASAQPWFCPETLESHTQVGGPISVLLSPLSLLWLKV